MTVPSWVNLKTEVTKIQCESSENVKVICKDGSEFCADHVICTVSLGVLKDCHMSLFEPKLPEVKQKAIQYLGIGCVNKLHFEFPVKWWPENLTGFNFLWESDDESAPNFWESDDPNVLETIYDGVCLYFGFIVAFTFSNESMNYFHCSKFPLWTRALIGFYPVTSHPLAMNAWVTGPSARHVETLPPQIVQTTCINLLKRFIGSKFEIPDPVNFCRSNWYTNPFTRGSYSFRQVSSELNDVWATHLSLPILSPNKKPVSFQTDNCLFMMMNEYCTQRTDSTIVNLYPSFLLLVDLLCWGSNSFTLLFNCTWCFRNWSEGSSKAQRVL